MALVEIVIKADPGNVVKSIVADARKAHVNAIRKALAIIERQHKRVEWLPGGGAKNSLEPHPTKLRVRSGVLKRSYTRKIDVKLLEGYYGSDVVYAPVHEYGSPRLGVPARPGVDNASKATKNAVEKALADALKREGL